MSSFSLFNTEQRNRSAGSKKKKKKDEGLRKQNEEVFAGEGVQTQRRWRQSAETVMAAPRFGDRAVCEPVTERERGDEEVEKEGN
ncbi:Hypothetical predicted protein [Scomber scombrus]|uniref:Uncharacterized protein n=1 Tax=Scomber scombrus TaxID=13677 RepID=A0AAV1PWZ5_SCOSC